MNNVDKMDVLSNIKKDIGLYIHIPFCKAKCYYCDFNSYVNKEKYIAVYIDALINELKEYNLYKYNIKTIYIGGGTPSLIDISLIEKLLQKIDISSAVEITIEVNPGTVTASKLRKYLEIGINRLSIGLQSSNNKILNCIGRIHTYQDFLETYNMARNIGFKNINVDLIVGLPNQTFEDVKNTVIDISNLNPEHISVYSLILEAGTRLYEKIIVKKELQIPSDDIERKMYWFVKEYLESKNYIHYEISNFALAGYESKHNIDCWRQKEYIGIGAGASSFLNNRRYINSKNIEEYIFNNKRNTEEILDKEGKMREFIILGLRMLKGIDLTEFETLYGKNLLMEFKGESDKLIKNDLLKVENNFLKLTNRGIDLANIVWEEFL